MQFSTLLTLGLASLATASASCDYPTFKLVNPLYGAWASGKYAVMKGDDSGRGSQFYFNSNDSSDAVTFTLDAATKQLWAGNNVANWLAATGIYPAVFFTEPSAVNTGATYLTCGVPTEDGETFDCSADGTAEHHQWDMCWGNFGGIGLELVYGNATGPYPTPHYIQNWLYCGGVRLEVEDLACGEAPA